ncbi:MAG: hypothetical protein BRD49_05105, partial [Bacteroidetes bacterium SW_10_40_5]
KVLITHQSREECLGSLLTFVPVGRENGMGLIWNKSKRAHNNCLGLEVLIRWWQLPKFYAQICANKVY